MTTHRTGAELRRMLDHPVIDADGHWLEHPAVVGDELTRIGGEAAARGFLSFSRAASDSLSMTVAERRRRLLSQEAFWATPTRNTLDRATAMMPALLHHRLDELGIDFAIMYPTMGLGTTRIADDGDRVATCRAFNVYQAEQFAPFAHRMTPAAVIPLHTPEEAIAELDHAFGELGLKAAMFGSLMMRPNPLLVDVDPTLALRFGWQDVIGIDSAHDYDPVWERCAQLGVSPTFHTGTRRSGLRTSPSNFVYNHIGHFAAAGEAVCKALFLGGVTRRFPTLRFGFLEGGAGWAAQLVGDLVEHWEKRGRLGLEATRPSNLDVSALLELVRQHGDERFVAVVEAGADRLAAGDGYTGGVADIDDFHHCRIEVAADIGELFIDRFWFGCEADDRMNAVALSADHSPFGRPLRAMLGSDIGHFDVEHMNRVLPEAHELVDDGLITEDDFRRFVFTNPARFWAETNPSFFVGTSVEQAVADMLSATDAVGTVDDAVSTVDDAVSTVAD
ncbi:MAG: amidohydrolase family protein [Acidimicrobiales bacterium]